MTKFTVNGDVIVLNNYLKYWKHKKLSSAKKLNNLFYFLG